MTECFIVRRKRKKNFNFSLLSLQLPLLANFASLPSPVSRRVSRRFPVSFPGGPSFPLPVFEVIPFCNSQKPLPVFELDPFPSKEHLRETCGNGGRKGTSTRKFRVSVIFSDFQTVGPPQPRFYGTAPSLPSRGGNGNFLYKSSYESPHNCISAG